MSKRPVEQKENSLVGIHARIAGVGGSLILAGLLSTVGAVQVSRAESPGPAWKVIRTSDELSIYEKNRQKGNKARAILARSELDLPPWRIWRALNDFSRFPEFIPFVEETVVLARGEKELLLFQLVDSPWPIQNRCFTVRMQLELPLKPTGHYRQSWDLAPPSMQIERECGIRTPTNRGYWDLEPLDGGARTRLTYLIESDPGGKLPGFAVAYSHRRAVPKLFESIREQASQARYARPNAQGEVEEIPFPNDEDPAPFRGELH